MKRAGGSNLRRSVCRQGRPAVAVRQKAEINPSSSTLHPSRFSSYNSDGFTLIELIVVLLIIGISLGLAGVFVNQGADNLALRRFARDVAVTLKYARNHAVSEKKIYSFIVYEDDSTYGLYKTDITKYRETAEVQPVRGKRIPSNFQISFDKGDAEQIRIDFFPGGNSTGGVIDIRSPEDRNLQVTVNRITGRVEIGKN